MGSARVYILERPIYNISMAAAFLGLPRDTVRRWLDGYERNDKRYPPVIRAAATGNEIVTWGEFVELGYLREYRNTGVPLQRLRPVIDKLRDEFQTPYPLATAKPYVMGKDLVLKLQQDSGIPPPLAIVIASGQTVILAKGAQRFVNKVEFNPHEDGEVLRLYPAGNTTPVVIDPLMRFGRPTVRGVAVERLWELHDAGEQIAELARDYEMSKELIKAAITYEEHQRLLAA